MSNPVPGAVRRPAHRTAAVAALAVLTLVLAGCGGGAPGGAAGSGGGAAAPSSSGAGVGLPAGTPGQGKPAVTVGDKDFSEAFLIGDLYEQALKAKGYTVNLKANVGGSEVIDSAFKAGQIDVYPEYTGEILSSVAGDQGRTTSAEETWQKAKAFEEANRGATLLPQTPFQDIDVVIVKPEFASAHNLKAIGDLKNVGPGGQGVSWAAQPPDKTRYAGLVGMQQAYGLTNVAFVGVDVGVTYSALDTGTVNSADAFSTDGQLTTNKYTVLDDPEHIMGFQHVAPVVKQSVLAAQGPEFAQTLNWVDSLLTQQAILQMNAAIQLNHVDPATVAQKFLAANGLQS
ncbi:MAG: osmoprotectant transport system substrate-binding protein [Pseudonocardiales bacterium]|jgi:osmoprotectant transport system substrate-binding protein|uniref:ABC transporter substrate-binding protein n=1 Tax=Pseudonocardia sp. Cha107L01 TaxID=3457576 RepID=UPI0028CA1CA3|nr:osmoprotectant transport system substrate-binding protein [Pseudonocardiales bacterium]MDT7569396.1 osmoprotectant transport system substrate-binding protein [Pseudonocardiales bacterium]MDT7610755.1 osmoprotectant transport system substrate-binding protein [Pseudonocardiales bacterium]MDT7646612.1 osmoprotectant transport system substrate-binding protein [Pseudonocardiales bacterium]MDT7669092.1 osmoprotectant transport system substrate-binding protein [Pseudonocardiales bacterium]